MPQMSPLMWCNLFILFSGLLTLSMVKIYFFSNKPLEIKTLSSSKTEISQISWMW